MSGGEIHTFWARPGALSAYGYSPLYFLIPQKIRAETRLFWLILPIFINYYG